jgi:hypothetical protein
VVLLLTRAAWEAQEGEGGQGHLGTPVVWAAPLALGVPPLVLAAPLALGVPPLDVVAPLVLGAPPLDEVARLRPAWVVLGRQKRARVR